MTVLRSSTLADVGIDAAAIKPSEIDLDSVTALDIETIIIDYEGRKHVPDPSRLGELARAFEVRVTMPVRADGFDPLGDRSLLDEIPPTVDPVFVAGHPAYLTDREKRRAIAPRLAASVETVKDPWIGTEGVERIAMAVGGTQFDLLSTTTRRDVRALRAAGFDGDVAVYAPTVLTEVEDAVLDAVGAYAARRTAVRQELPANTPTDSSIAGAARETLERACKEYALVGGPETVSERVAGLHDVGVDYVVGYPARGLESVSG